MKLCCFPPFLFEGSLVGGSTAALVAFDGIGFLLIVEGCCFSL